VNACDGLLVVGTSLEVFSAFRFVKRAAERGVPIAIINKGETRAERSNMETIRFKSEADCTDLLKHTAALVGGTASS
jgi:NAD-dependent SIR2 family protein deacetylase